MRVKVETPSTPDVGPHGEPIQPYPWLTAEGGKIEPTRCTLPDGEYVLVALDGIDVEALHLAIETLSDGPMLREMTRHNAEAFVDAIAVVVGSARHLLAAIDGGAQL